MTSTLKSSSEIRPGDLIDICGGAPILVATLEPYTHPTVPGFFAIARGADGRGISLNHANAVRVVTA